MITAQDLIAAMQLIQFDTQAAQAAMAPSPRVRLPQFDGTTPKQAGVLALTYPADDGALRIVLTRRQDSLRGHSGQISFPGGRRDPEDTSFTATALRETHEELGIPPDTIRIIGALGHFYIPPSNYDVYPSVGLMDTAPTFYPSPAEVAEVITASLQALLIPNNKQREKRSFKGFAMTVPYYNIKGHKVWGATAAMLSELEQRLRHV
jgi:8-oxo-dGTP pyrophosphatase MutT (NUDIX family)